MRDSSEYLSASFQEEYKFFPYVVIYMILMYFCVSIVFAYAFMNNRYHAHEEKKPLPSEHESCCEVCWAYFKGMFCCCCKICSRLCCCITRRRPSLYFDSIFDSNWGLLGALLLLTGRIVLSAFIVYYSLYESYKNGNDETQSSNSIFYHFPFWVHISLAIYFICASFSSLVGLLNRICCVNRDTGKVNWSPLMEQFGVILLIVFEMAACNIIFLLIIQFSFFSSVVDFQQVRLYIVPSAAIVFELLFNRVPFRGVYYGFAAGLPMSYLIFQWVLVYTGQLQWQYAVLQTQHAICFRRYSVMAGVHVGTFGALIFLFFLRDQIFRIKYGDRFRSDFDDADDESHGENNIDIAHHDVEVNDSEDPALANIYEDASAPPIAFAHDSDRENQYSKDIEHF